MSSKKGVSKKLIIGLIVASILVVSVISVTLVLFINREKNKDVERFDSGLIKMTYAENSNIFFLDKLVPTSDAVGKLSNDASQYYDFTINVDLRDSASVSYELALKIDEEFTSALPNTMRVYLERQESGSYVPVLEPTSFSELNSKSQYGASNDEVIIASVSSKENISHNYRLRMWLAEDTLVDPEVTQSFGVEINVYGEAN